MIWQQSICRKAERHPGPVHAVTTIKSGNGLGGGSEIESVMDGLFGKNPRQESVLNNRSDEMLRRGLG